MLKSAKIFLGLPIISLATSHKIGSIEDFIIEKQNGVVIGVIGLRYGFLKRKNKVISFVDMRELSEKALVVDSEDVLVDQQEILEIDRNIKAGIKIIGSKVYSIQGQYFGKVFDYLIDDYFQVSKIYIYPPIYNVLENQLIIARDRIVKTVKGKIIINTDNYDETKSPETAKVSIS